MSDPNTTKPAAQQWDGQNVVAISFEDDRNAYNALTSLNELGSQERIGVHEAVVVARGEDGKVVEKDRVESNAVPATAVGGLSGLLIGILGGPLGVLIGGTYGLMVGSLFDMYDLGETDSALAAISASVGLGRTALLAVVDERSPEVLDTAMSDLGGTVVRRPVAEVEAEIAAAEEAERQAKHEARKELVRARRERDKGAVRAKVAELNAKVRREPAPAGSGS
jgi:uncharacterized membrane protein